MAIKSILLKGRNLEEARSKIKENIPPNFVIISEKIIEDGTPKEIIETDYHGDTAFHNAALKVPKHSVIIKSAVYKYEQKTELELEKGKDVKSELKRICPEAEFMHSNLINKGKKGFLGIRKKPDLFKVTYRLPAKAVISYRPQAVIEIEYGSETDKEKVPKSNIEKANKIIEEATFLFTQKQSHSMDDTHLLLKISNMYTQAIELDPSQSRFYNNRGFINYQVTLILLPHVSEEGRIGFFCKNDDRFKEIDNETGFLSDEVRKLLYECINISLRDFTKAIELNPKDTGGARTSLANVLFDLGRFDDAQKELKTAKLHAKEQEIINRINSDLDRIKKVVRKETSDKVNRTEIVKELDELRLNISELPRKYPSQITIITFERDKLHDQVPIICDNINDVISALKKGRDVYNNPISTKDISLGINSLLSNSIGKSGWELLMESILNDRGLQLLRGYLNQLGDIAERIKILDELTPASLSGDATKMIPGKTNKFLYKTLSGDELKLLLKKHKAGNFINDFQLKTINGDNVVIDNVTGLMWHQSGSPSFMAYRKVQEWIEDLNRTGYAGYFDWRLPTVEEAVSLLENDKKNGLYIDLIFSKDQALIWTGNGIPEEPNAHLTVCFLRGYVVVEFDHKLNFVRPLRSL